MTTATHALLFDTGVWRVDPARSHVGFAIRHLRVATVRGRFGTFTGRIRNTGDGLRIDGHVEARSVDTGERVRDERLRTGFFAAQRFPLIEFGARCVAPAPGQHWLVAGTLTIRDALRPVVLRATTEPLGDDAIRVVLDGEIRRSDFGLDWAALREAGRLLVADRVQLRAGIVLTREPAAGSDR
jgi:polyisoprenoid-binding protein YceI